ncbi:NAD(P)H-dependent flavin oxidoreductase [Mycobacterium decipiens]|uniref:NAD(P)H-dependent flavin oxidoreductase n=1 Tax=Mycobacterium decipiens TaxID=1430326 RepID=UPI0024187D62|nr:nitronate monooxygenase [Mycobacterium decipiens]
MATLAQEVLAQEVVLALSTALTRMFGIDYPIVSAPMDVIAGGELAAAVSRAGGLGLIGGGYGDRDWLAQQFDLAAGTPVGCGFITWSLARQPQLLDLALQREPVAVMLSFGDPAAFADRIKSAGARLVCQIQDRAQAERALQVGADVLVAQGSEAGGHGCGPRSTLTLVPEIVDLVTARGADTPVVAAGGIADGRGLAAALMLEAAGVLVGTRFYATIEALSTPQARDRLVAATGDDMCRTTIYDQLRGYPWPDGHTMSVLRNALTERFEGTELDLRHDDDTITKYRQAVTAHDYTIANVTAGQAAGLVDAVVSAAAVVTGMAQQAATALTAMRVT